MNSRNGQAKDPVHRGMEREEKVIINFLGKKKKIGNARFEDGPTQHSMIKSRVSLAQVTSLGRSSVYAMYHVFMRVHVSIAQV